jgi:hypothetical protein
MMKWKCFRSSCDLTDAIARRLPGGSEETHKKVSYPMFRPRFEPIASGYTPRALFPDESAKYQRFGRLCCLHLQVFIYKTKTLYVSEDRNPNKHSKHNGTKFFLKINSFSAIQVVRRLLWNPNITSPGSAKPGIGP